MSNLDNTNIESEKPELMTTPVNSKADIENFYRFVYDNDLRREAKMALGEILKVIKPKKSRRGRKKGSKNKVQ